jgi:protein required for attachment to host cells
MKAIPTYILIADSAQASIFRYQGPSSPLEKLKSFSHAHLPTRESISTEQGRMPDNGKNQRSALEQPTDPYRYEKYRFANELANYLIERNEVIERLIIVAAPQILGDLRKLLPKKVTQHITHELDKDLTNIPESDLPKHFQAILNIQSKLSNQPNRESRYAK